MFLDAAAAFTLGATPAFIAGVPGHWEIIAVLFIVLIIFGPKNLPKLAKSVGSSIRDFKSGLKGVDEELEEAEEAVNAPVETKAQIESKKSISTETDKEKVGSKEYPGQDPAKTD